MGSFGIYEYTSNFHVFLGNQIVFAPVLCLHVLVRWVCQNFSMQLMWVWTRQLFFRVIHVARAISLHISAVLERGAMIVTKYHSFGWWFRNPANQLRLVVYPIIYKVFYIQTVVANGTSEPSTRYVSISHDGPDGPELGDFWRLGSLKKKKRFQTWSYLEYLEDLQQIVESISWMIYSIKDL